MSGLIGKKIGMTSIFDANGKNMPCTVLEVGPCVVTQVRTEEVDGYAALQLGFDDKTEKSATKADLGHAKKAGTSVKRKVAEFKGFDEEYKLGDSITVDHFTEGEFVDVSGTSKGKGFQGVVNVMDLQVWVKRLTVSTTVYVHQDLLVRLRIQLEFSKE